jgi:hypothetical protein
MNKRFFILIAILIALLLIAGALWCKQYRQPIAVNQPVVTDPVVETPVQVEPENPIDTSDWKTYRNQQISIQFEYPALWGSITMSKEIGCVDYYAKDVVMPKDVKDSCLHLTLSASNFDHGAFLSTEGIDYTNTEIPRGADWRYRLASITKDQEDFCSNNPFILMDGKIGHLGNCETFKTSNGLIVTKGVRAVPFVEKETMVVYFIRTNHPVYYDLVISSRYIGSPVAESDIRKLIETIKL